MQLPSQAAELTSLCRARPLLGTRVEIAARGSGSPRDLHAAIDAAFACVARVQSLMSYQDRGSDLSRLNEAALERAQHLDAHTYRVCAAAIDLARASVGAFDPTVAGSLEGLQLLPQAGQPCDPSASWRDIELCADNAVRFHRPLRVDLGGIAKGYAVDLAVHELARHGVESASVNAGGDLRVAGCLPQFIHVRHPLRPLHLAHTLAVQNGAIATSAAYFSRRAHPQGEVSALIDARSGTPYLGRRSVSVQAPECMLADALTKVVLFAPDSLAAACLAAHQAQAYILE